MSHRPDGERATGDRHPLERLLDRRGVRLGILVGLGLLVLFRLAHFLVGTADRAWGYDFAAYWLAGRAVLDGAPLYAPLQLAGPYPAQEQGLYLYPPLLAVLVAPLSALFAEYRDAMWPWAAGGALVTGLTCWWLAGSAGIERRLGRSVLVAGTFALVPVAFELIMGNVHLLLFGLLGAAWLALRRGGRGDYLAGAALAVAALVKVFPALLLAWLLLTGRWRVAAAAIVSAGVLVVATLPLVGVDPWLHYPRVLANLQPPAELWSSLAPTAALAEWLDFGLARALVVVGGLALLGWSSRRQPPAVSFAVAVMVSLLIVPTVYPHYLALAALPLLLAVLYVAPLALPLAAWLVFLVGGQLALADLADPLVRLAALVAAVAPLVCLLLVRRGRVAADSGAVQLARAGPG